MPTNIAQVIIDAYPDSDLLTVVPDDFHRLEELVDYLDDHSVGDSLFTFIVREIHEGARDEAGSITPERVQRVLSRAVADINAVRGAVTTHLVALAKDQNG